MIFHTICNILNMAHGQCVVSLKMFFEADCISACKDVAAQHNQFINIASATYRISYISHQHSHNTMNASTSHLLTVHRINIAVNTLRLQNFFIALNLSCLCALDVASCGMQQCYNDTSVQPWTNYTLEMKYVCEIF